MNVFEIFLEMKPSYMYIYILYYIIVQLNHLYKWYNTTTPKAGVLNINTMTSFRGGERGNRTDMQLIMKSTEQARPFHKPAER